MNICVQVAQWHKKAKNVRLQCYYMYSKSTESNEVIFIKLNDNVIHCKIVCYIYFNYYKNLFTVSVSYYKYTYVIFQ